MSIECSECERSARGGHAEDCSRHPNNRQERRIVGVERARVDALETENKRLNAAIHLALLEEEGGKSPKWVLILRASLTDADKPKPQREYLHRDPNRDEWSDMTDVAKADEG